MIVLTIRDDFKEANHSLPLSSFKLNSRMEGVGIAALFAGISTLLLVVIAISAVVANRYYKSYLPAVHQIAEGIAQELRLQAPPVNRVPGSSLSEVDAAKLPSYAEAAICPVQTTINMNTRTPSTLSRDISSIPSPYESSVQTANSGQYGTPEEPATPGIGAPPSRQSSNLRNAALTQGPPPPASSLLPPAQRSSTGLSSRLASSLRISSMADGEGSTAPTPVGAKFRLATEPISTIALRTVCHCCTIPLPMFLQRYPFEHLRHLLGCASDISRNEGSDRRPLWFCLGSLVGLSSPTIEPTLYGRYHAMYHHMVLCYYMLSAVLAWMIPQITTLPPLTAPLPQSHFNRRITVFKTDGRSTT
ncbi:hypothetical protein CALCODRAFT_359758 [Calocera cornea HHB12733]|uniref:Uncharacterized protein n=1 Tax=Calocera cornea HHB12733 TaxID=1353952 RepID=A0A165EMC5_9BASI|nr:hypothetical protein CALCODRAFT_359758 [Calocera cornea HHB12733]